MVKQKDKQITALDNENKSLDKLAYLRRIRISMFRASSNYYQSMSYIFLALFLLIVFVIVGLNAAKTLDNLETKYNATEPGLMQYESTTDCFDYYNKKIEGVVCKGQISEGWKYNILIGVMIVLAWATLFALIFLMYHIIHAYNRYKSWKYEEKYYENYKCNNEIRTEESE